MRAAAMTPAAAVFGAERSLKTIGVQLYTVRDVILKDPAKTLGEIEKIGYREVEVVGATVDKIWPALEKTKLKAVSVHMDTDVIFPGHEKKLDEAIEQAKTHGFSYVVFPYLPEEQRGGEAVYQKLAGYLNAAGKKAKAAGLAFCYHNHAFEFQPMGGTMPLEILMKGTDPELVSLEMDVFWVSVAGHDPVEMLHKYASRVALLHLKDKAAGTAVQYNEHVARTAFKEVGSGTVDIKAALQAAEGTRVKHYFVEQDATPGDPVASLRKSFEYLHGLKY